MVGYDISFNYLYPNAEALTVFDAKPKPPILLRAVYFVLAPPYNPLSSSSSTSISFSPESSFSVSIISPLAIYSSLYFFYSSFYFSTSITIAFLLTSALLSINIVQKLEWPLINANANGVLPYLSGKSTGAFIFIIYLPDITEPRNAA